jgi:tetratricopeptide (TPR) repeat protein
MGQTAEDVRDNIVQIVSKEGQFAGTGFFVQKEYCVTCHHCICRLDEIFVTREGKDKFPAEWVQEYSDMEKDIAVLRVKGHDFLPLQCKKETYPKISVVVVGFPGDDLYHFPEGKNEEGTLAATSKQIRWKSEDMEGGRPWNKKPETKIRVYGFGGKFEEGFSGAPVCYQEDHKVVGMFEAKDENDGYIIPIDEVLQLFEERKLATTPSESLDSAAIIDLGNEFYFKKDFANAIKQYDKVLHDPNLATAWFNKAYVLNELKQYKEAIECYDRVIELYPDNVIAWNNKGQVLNNLGQYKEAIKFCDRAIELDPNLAAAWNNKGLSLYNLGQYKQAIKCYDKAIELDPNLAVTWSNKGYALQKLGKHDEAEKCLKKARDLGFEA